MLNKETLEAKIIETFPDINNTEIVINNQINVSFTEVNLMPFLVFQNTVDQNHRVIGLYLPANSNVINLVPFYIIMAQLRKALDVVMRDKGFQNQSFSRRPEFQLQVLNERGNIGYVSSVDYLNRQISVIYGTGQNIIPFAKSYTLQGYSDAGNLFLDNLSKFEKIDKANKKNIFTFPVAAKVDHYEGVMMFTNVTKFESLIRNIKVSGDDLRDHVNIQKVIFPPNDGIPELKRISAEITREKPISVCIARQDAFRAYSLLMKKPQLKHVRTIIIDEFDELVKQWEKTDVLGEQLEQLKNSFETSIQQRQIKDIYLICKNSRLDVHQLLKAKGFDYFPWLVQPLEKEHLDERTTSPEIHIANVGVAKFEEFNQRINQLLCKWRDLGKNYFFNGDIIKPISCLFELRTKLNSFHNPDILPEFLTSFEACLNTIKSDWFFNDQDCGLVDNTIKLVHTCKDHLGNFKAACIIDVIKNKIPLKHLFIISDNRNEDDINWLLSHLKINFTALDIQHFYKNSAFQIKPDLICYLTADKYIIGNALGNVLAKDQVFILNKRSFLFASSFSKKYQQLQSEAGCVKRKKQLLNLNSDFPVNEGSFHIPITENNVHIEQENNVGEPTELNDLVKEIIPVIAAGNAEPKCILFFDDGSNKIFANTNKIYLYDDEKEADDLEKAYKQACELEAGDQVIITKKDADLKEVLENALQKDEKFKKVLDMDWMWRRRINDHIKRCSMDLDYFRRKLNEYQYSVSANQTVQNWIEGNTRRPENFTSLLNALSNLKIIDAEQINDYDKSNSELKKEQIKFVRNAVRKLVERLNGISNSDIEFNDELLNDFLDHIEVKRITSVHII